jgi:RNA polymerase II-associated factor 1
MSLTLRRLQIHEIYDQKWEVINITHGPMDPKEKMDRAEALAEVLDPDYYLLVRDADGEPEDEADGMDNGSGSLGPDVGLVQT